jgi:hypothetical protein
MINVNDKLIREELPKIGVDAFAVLMCITSHINRQNKAWPGIDRLRTMTRLSRDRTYKAIAVLVELGHIERKQKNVKGEYGHMVYRLTTQYLGVYMGVSSFELPADESEPLTGKPEYGNAGHGKPSHGNPGSISIKKQEVVNEDEVINERESAPAQFLVTTVALETIEPAQNEYTATAPNWMDVARQMLEYSKGEGKDQYQFLCEGTKFTGDPMPIFTTWAGKASPYQLKNWKKEFSKLGTWFNTEAQRRNKPNGYQQATQAQQTQIIRDL